MYVFPVSGSTDGDVPLGRTEFLRVRTAALDGPSHCQSLLPQHYTGSLPFKHLLPRLVSGSQIWFRYF